MTVKAQNQIFVRGRGLEIDVIRRDGRGTAAKPILGGGLKLGMVPWVC